MNTSLLEQVSLLSPHKSSNHVLRKKLLKIFLSGSPKLAFLSLLPCFLTSLLLSSPIFAFCFLTADFRFPLFPLISVILQYIWLLGYRRMFSQIPHFISYKEGRGMFRLGWVRSVVWVCFFGSAFLFFFFFFFFSSFFLFFFFFYLALRKKKKKVSGEMDGKGFFGFRDLLLIYLFPPHYRPLDRFI